MKKHIVIAAMIVAVGGLSACGTSSNVATTPSAGVTSLTGVVTKGPFAIGSTVNAYSLTNGVRSATPIASGSVTDLGGGYTVVLPAGAVGPFEIEVIGKYVDETTGKLSTTSQSLTAVVNPAPVGSNARQTITTNVNAVTAVQASLVKQTLADPYTTGTVNAILKSTGTLALQALGVNTVDAYGAVVDPTQLNFMDPAADPTLAAQLLNASALFAQVVNDAYTANPAAPITTAQISQVFAKDIQAGVAIGSTDPYVTTAALTTATANVPTKTQLVTNLNTGVSAAATANPTATAPAAVVNTVTVIAPSVTALKGLAMLGNTFTLGTASYTVDVYGAATIATPGVATTTAATNVVLGFTLADYSGNTGVTNINTSLGFDIHSTVPGDKRAIKGSVTPVVITTNGLGNVSMTIPANATMTYSGIDSAGTAVSGAPVNVAANVIQTTASMVAIDANALLNTVQAKVAPQNAQFNILSKAGIFAFSFTLGTNIGHQNAGVIDQLFKLSNGGRGISGTLVTK